MRLRAFPSSMFHEHHHRSAFPLLVVGLTLALLLGLALLFGPQVREQRLHPVTSATTANYEQQAGKIIARLEERLVVAQEADARYEVLSSATSELLTLVVPEGSQSVHLELISSLDLLRQGSLGDEAKTGEGTRRLEALQSQYTWLK